MPEDARNLVAVNVAYVETVLPSYQGRYRLAAHRLPFLPEDADEPENGINLAEVLADTR